MLTFKAIVGPLSAVIYAKFLLHMILVNQDMAGYF